MTQAIDSTDRANIARAVAKAIAFKNCGDQRKANLWATRVVYLLDTMDILDQAQLSKVDSAFLVGAAEA